MSILKKLLVVLIILLVVATLYAGAMVPEDMAGEGEGSKADVSSYAAPGPHLVGSRNLTMDAEPHLELTAWYPATGGDVDGAITYPYELKIIPRLGATSIATYDGQALSSAPYDLAAGPYPLIILSPGFAIGSAAYGWLAEHLASYGFVVISPEHDEHLMTAMNELWQSAIVRPQVTVSLLDHMDREAESGGQFEGLIDPAFSAVIGHSYGGYTALATAGAQFDISGFEARCRVAYETTDPGAWLCDALLPHLSEMAELAGLDAIPDGLWSAWADPRIDAAVSMAGDAYLFDEAGLAEIDVPLLAIGGTGDRDTPYMWGTHPTYEFASSPRKARIALHDAEHMVFAGPCEMVRRFIEIVPNQFCSDPVWNRARARTIIKHLTTAFLLAELRQDAAASTSLAPDAVAFPDVTYDSEGY